MAIKAGKYLLLIEKYQSHCRIVPEFVVLLFEKL